MKLVSITLAGVMCGPIWWPAGEVCTTEFHKDFAAPGAPHSPWQEDWQSLDEALQSVLTCSDFQGGQGELVEGIITFHMAGERATATVSKSLEVMHAAKPYLAESAA